MLQVYQRKSCLWALDLHKKWRKRPGKDGGIGIKSHRMVTIHTISIGLDKG